MTSLGVEELYMISQEELVADLDAVLAKANADSSPVLIIADGKPDALLFGWEDYKRRFSMLYPPGEFEKLEEEFKRRAFDNELIGDD